jgi:hypothetical protein
MMGPSSSGQGPPQIPGGMMGGQRRHGSGGRLDVHDGGPVRRGSDRFP